MMFRRGMGRSAFALMLGALTVAACGSDPVLLDTPASVPAVEQPASTVLTPQAPASSVSPAGVIPDTQAPGGSDATGEGTSGDGASGDGVSQAQGDASTTASPNEPAQSEEATAVPVDVSASSFAGVSFGTPADEALTQLTQLFGSPTTDTGWKADQSPCEGDGSRQRAVEWPGIMAIFATGPTGLVIDPVDHFVAFIVTESEVAQRVRIDDVEVFGKTVSQLQEQLAGVTSFESEIEGPVWVIRSNGPGTLSGSLGEDGSVQSARGGLLCID
jgi:hypothetical protein